VSCRDDLSEDQIEPTPKGDYHYRLRMPKAELAKLMFDKILNIDYDNFKNHGYYNAAIETWSAMCGLQRRLEHDGSTRED
jgi:hypothetical protein